VLEEEEEEEKENFQHSRYRGAARHHVISQRALRKKGPAISRSSWRPLKMNSKLNYLIHNLKAYENFRIGGRGIRNAVKSHLYKWAKSQEGMSSMEIPVLVEDLQRKAKTTTQKQLLQDTSTQN
jgi:hypothetical protein